MSLNLSLSARLRQPAPRPREADEETRRRWAEEDRRREERLARIERTLAAFPDFAEALAEVARRREETGEPR